MLISEADNSHMPAQPLTEEQRADAERLKSVFLREKKIHKNLTQESLAEACGWKTQGTVSQYMNGKIPLNLPALCKFAEAMEVDPAEISPSLALTMVISGSIKATAANKVLARSLSAQTSVSNETPSVTYAQIKAAVSGVLKAFGLDYTDLVLNDQAIETGINNKLCRSSNTGKPVEMAESPSKQAKYPGAKDAGIATDASIKESPRERAEGER